MTRLRIQHETRYEYASLVTLGRHRLVLRPRESHELQIERMTIWISPAHRADWARDVFGNSILFVDFTEPAQELIIQTDVTVQRARPFPCQQPQEPWKIAFPVVYDVLETTVAVAYQVLSYPDDADAVRGWLKENLPKPTSQDAEGYLFSLGELIYKTIQYRRRAERGVQTPAQTLQLQSGSCRDMATLMMDAVRILGVAARFASGYLDCAASAAGRASMHAWTEVYLPTLGWRGYDPTIGAPTSLKHVVVGVSNHPRGVMPVTGIYNSASGTTQQMTAHVRIEALPDNEQTQAEIPVEVIGESSSPSTTIFETGQAISRFKQ